MWTRADHQEVELLSTSGERLPRSADQDLALDVIAQLAEDVVEQPLAGAPRRSLVVRPSGVERGDRTEVLRLHDVDRAHARARAVREPSTELERVPRLGRFAQCHPDEPQLRGACPEVTWRHGDSTRRAAQRSGGIVAGEDAPSAGEMGRPHDDEIRAAGLSERVQRTGRRRIRDHAGPRGDACLGELALELGPELLRERRLRSLGLVEIDAAIALIDMDGHELAATGALQQRGKRKGVATALAAVHAREYAPEQWRSNCGWHSHHGRRWVPVRHRSRTRAAAGKTTDFTVEVTFTDDGDRTPCGHESRSCTASVFDGGVGQATTVPTFLTLPCSCSRSARGAYR